MNYGLVALGVLNGAVTGVIWTTGDYLPEQRRAQTVFVWLIPVLGALVVLAMRWGDRSNPS